MCSDYVKSTNFATKDNLSSGNALKIVKGTEIDTEFNNIATAVATKADLNSPTFVGTPSLPTGTTATTQSFGTNATSLATTAFVQAALAAMFPVGAIYTATVSTNPATLLGFGTWTAFAAGRTLIGNGGGFSAGATGGSADAIVVSHSHSATTTSTDLGHVHGGTSSTNTNLIQGGGLGMFVHLNTQPLNNSGSGNANISSSTTVAAAGSSGTNANLQPYVVVYMWTRTA